MLVGSLPHLNDTLIPTRAQGIVETRDLARLEGCRDSLPGLTAFVEQPRGSREIAQQQDASDPNDNKGQAEGNDGRQDNREPLFIPVAPDASPVTTESAWLPISRAVEMPRPQPMRARRDRIRRAAHISSPPPTRATGKSAAGIR